ncbi:isocitrate lyase/phosphoenolpyruvate mutase family protein [Dactylosporangium sp. CA-139066]|uniref:isocitrate lyase/phosphoenolpyruvate mutase family protein n=1 Tax=Dactylosporangium sp. CA-139066 TaxID=3239930 RepID=UPI003D8ACB10
MMVAEYQARRQRLLPPGERSAPVLLVGTHNAAVARIAEEAGFDGCWVSSLEISATKGIPDRNLLGAKEMIDVAQTIRSATTLPVVVDCDNGYGTDLAAARVARELHLGGVTGMCIEDSAFPKRNSLIKSVDRSLESREAFAGRVARARAATGDDFVIVARTEALIAGLPLDDAIERAQSYAEAGADIVVVHSNGGEVTELWEIAKKWTGPARLASIPTAYTNVTLDELGDAGYGMVVYANHLLRGALATMTRLAAQLRRGGQLSALTGLVPIQEILRLSGEPGVVAA